MLEGGYATMRVLVASTISNESKKLLSADVKCIARTVDQSFVVPALSLIK